MHALAEIVKSVEKDGDTWLVVRLPKSRLKEEIENHHEHRNAFRRWAAHFQSAAEESIRDHPGYSY